MLPITIVGEDFLTMATAVIYARVSSTGERQSTSRQVADLTNYASLNGLKVVEVYEEHISGAKRNEERAVLTECIDYAVTNGVEVVLFSELSRCGRAVWEVLDTIRTLKDNGINAYFQKEGLSLFGADGKENPYLAVMVSVLGVCAQLERENITYRLNSGRAKYIADGGKLVSVEIDGEPLDDDKVYGLATISFLLGGGDGLALDHNALSVTVYEDVQIIDAVLEHIKAETAAGRPIEYKTDGRVVVKNPVNRR